MKLKNTQTDHSMILNFLIIIKTFHLDVAGDYFRIPHRFKTGPVLEGNPRRCIVTICKIRTRHIRNEIINGYLAGVPQTLAVHNYGFGFITEKEKLRLNRVVKLLPE